MIVFVWVKFKLFAKPQLIPQKIMSKDNFIRYWFDFEFETVYDLPPGIGMGCGVSAINYNDAINILDTKVFINFKRPPIRRVIEQIDIQQLDPGHIISNMRSPVDRGVWFPLGYD